MNEIERPLEVIETEINFYKGQTATGIIEIGKRLIEAKAQLQHGEWGKWLEEKIDIKERTAQRFMQVANECSNPSALTLLPQSKVFALLDVPQDQREEFIAATPIDDMTTRQLQQAIKEKKELEQMLEEEKNKPAKEVPPSDYEKLKSETLAFRHKLRSKEEEIERLEKNVSLAERKANLNDSEAKKFNEMKQQMEHLVKQKNDIGRQIRTATELSGLVVTIEHLLKNELAPIKYSRAITEAATDRVVIRNLQEIINRVQNWCDEMNRYLPNKNIVEATYERIND